MNSGVCCSRAFVVVDEHRAREERVPREFGDDADGQAVARVGARVGVLHEEVAPRRVLHHAVAQRVEFFLRELLVDLAPEDLVLGRRLADDGLVLGRAPGVLARVHHDRAVRRVQPLAAPRDLLVQLRRVQIPVDVGRRLDAERVQPHVAVPPPVLKGRGLFNSGHNFSSLIVIVNLYLFEMSRACRRGRARRKLIQTQPPPFPSSLSRTMSISASSFRSVCCRSPQAAAATPRVAVIASLLRL